MSSDRDDDRNDGVSCLAGLDGSGLLATFARLAAAPDATSTDVLEVAAMGVAIAELGLLDRAVPARAVAARARSVLLGAAAMRAAAVDEDARDALDLAIEQARRGVTLLAGGALGALEGPPTDEPTPHDVTRLLRGTLDGFSAADVALRLHRSGARSRYEAFLPARPVARIRLAADAAPDVRDPAHGRALGSQQLHGAVLEAVAFPDGAIAIYAEPAIDLALASIDARLAGRPAQASGYLELRIERGTPRVTLELESGAEIVRWELPLSS